nr:MAG TPA: hypothetical protein [Caudoviricetes sp.]
MPLPDTAKVVRKMRTTNTNWYCLSVPPSTS